MFGGCFDSRYSWQIDETSTHRGRGNGTHIEILIESDIINNSAQTRQVEIEVELWKNANFGQKPVISLLKF